MRILNRLSWRRDAPASQLCEVCAEVTEVTGAGIMLMLNERPHGSVCTTDDISALIEELQYTLGEGPCVDAHHEQRPIVEPDLADPSTVRWTAFSREALGAGARVVLGFPVTVRDVHLGALNLYRDRPGPLSEDQHADALMLAEVAGRAILGMQVGAADGALGVALEVGTNFRFVVHQAAGMVAVQLGVGVEDALAVVRAHAFRHGRPLVEVAHDVVERRLRFGGADDGQP